MSNTSKRGPKEAKFMDTTAFTFTEVNLESVKSAVWKYFLRYKKNSVAKCKICDNILKTVSSTSPLTNHLEKLHKVNLKTMNLVLLLPLLLPQKSLLPNLFYPKFNIRIYSNNYSENSN